MDIFDVWNILYINLSIQYLLSQSCILASGGLEVHAEGKFGSGSYSQVFWRAWKTLVASDIMWKSFEAQTTASKLPPLSVVLDMRVRYDPLPYYLKIFTN